MYKLGQILVIFSISLLFLAYSNFAPTALQSDVIAGYVKNHFVREIIFGIALSIWTIKLALQPQDKLPFRRLALLGSIVIFPFWIAVFFGWATQGLAQVWGDAINSQAAYYLHGTQVILFVLGLLLIKVFQNKSS